ncbi:hypothetical protein PInf_012180 [Phytophthora infestans]|nr:hypothetical protein PInf_012180 [Phytophthora infestans]
MSPRSGYDNASGYGAFAAPPSKANISPRSGYGAFDNASGYGAFAAPPAKVNMSPRSGYGAFDNASGYGAFASPPAKVNMSPRSGYGAFDNASGYGAFAAPPGGMSPRSGYGKFDDASGYGNFASPPDLRQGANLSKRDPDHYRRYQRNQDQSSQRGDRVHPVHPSSNQVQELQEHTNRARKVETPSESVLHAKYQHAFYRVGGEQAALSLWNSAGQTIWQRYMSRTELLQAVRRSFEKHERTSTFAQYSVHPNHGFMTKSQLKEALRDLGCVFTDDQITALFGMYDQHCTGTVPMSDLLLALTEIL